VTLGGRAEAVRGEVGTMADIDVVEGFSDHRLRGGRGQMGSRQCGASLGIREWTVGSPAVMNRQRGLEIALFTDDEENLKYLLLTTSWWGTCAPTVEGGGAHRIEVLAGTEG
jgi:hypothetical protein